MEGGSEWVKGRPKPAPPRCRNGVNSPYLPACGFPPGEIAPDQGSDLHNLSERRCGVYFEYQESPCREDPIPSTHIQPASYSIPLPDQRLVLSSRDDGSQSAYSTHGSGLTGRDPKSRDAAFTEVVNMEGRVSFLLWSTP